MGEEKTQEIPLKTAFITRQAIKAPSNALVPCPLAQAGELHQVVMSANCRVSKCAYGLKFCTDAG